MNTPNLEAIRQEHETWLTQLEGLAVQALASNDWEAFNDHINEMQTWLDCQPYWDKPEVVVRTPATIAAVTGQGIRPSDITALFEIENA